MASRAAHHDTPRAVEVAIHTTHAALYSLQPNHAGSAVQHALNAAQQHIKAAQEQIACLSETNARLRRKLSLLGQQAAQARHDAYHDQLTRLPNRGLLLDRLNQAIAQAVRRHRQVVLLLLDLDGFKAINDTLGHAVGDKLLQAVAERLVACIRSADTACRYGGDEFVVMLPEINGEEHCATVEQKIRTRLAAPYLIEGVELAMTVSIGTAVFPTDSKNHSELLKHADVAMYRAKTDKVITGFGSRRWLVR